MGSPACRQSRDTPAPKPPAPSRKPSGKPEGSGSINSTRGGRRPNPSRFEPLAEPCRLEVLGLLARNARSRPFVPEIFGAIDGRKEVLVLQERAIWGSVKAALSGEAPAMSVAHKLRAACQVGRAMAFLESVRIVHADLSCRNCLLFRLDEERPESTLVKVTDFGLALGIREGMQGETRKQPQATRWCAPETVAHNWYSFSSDVWALGATLWELFAGGLMPWRRWQKRANVAARLRTLAEVADADAAAGGGTPAAAEEDGKIAEDFAVFHEEEEDGALVSAIYEAVLSCLRVAELARPKAGQLIDTLERLADDSCRLRENGKGGGFCKNGSALLTDEIRS